MTYAEKAALEMAYNNITAIMLQMEMLRVRVTALEEAATQPGLRPVLTMKERARA